MGWRNTEEMDLLCGTGGTGGEEILLGPPSPVPSSKPQKSGTGRKLPAAEGGKQMLSAHSRKLETRPPAAYHLSRRGPPLAPTGSPEARWGTGSGSVSSAGAEEGGPEKSNWEPCFCPVRSLLPLLEHQGSFTACWADWGKPLFLSGPQWGLSGTRFTQQPSGFNR